MKTFKIEDSSVAKKFYPVIPMACSVKKLFSVVFVSFLSLTGFSQVLHNLVIANGEGLSTDQVVLSDSSAVIMTKSKPLFSFHFNNKFCSSALVPVEKTGNKYFQNFEKVINVTFHVSDSSASGWQGEIVFENTGEDTVSISNVVPFGEDNSSIYITGDGPADLARAKLFRPGLKPVRVILPDNAWEAGYSSFFAGYELSICAVARRTRTEGGQKHRYETMLPAKAKVSYLVHAGVFRGEWQNGLRMMFRDKFLYDIEKFDNSLYKRKDLEWIKESYLIILQMAWDREFYDRFTGKYT